MTKQEKESTAFETRDADALPIGVLKALVGGARPEDRHDLTPETAAGLTAGGQDAAMPDGSAHPAGADAKEIGKQFTGTLGKIGHANTSVDPAYLKVEKTLDHKMGRDGVTGTWKTTTTSSALDRLAADEDAPRGRLNAMTPQEAIKLKKDADPAPVKPAEPKKGLIEKTSGSIAKNTGSFLKEKGVSTGVKLLGQAREAIAVKEAKERGLYHESTLDEVLAGGVHQDVVKDGNRTVTTTSLAQVTAQGGAHSYATDAGSGAGAQIGITAEAGYQKAVKTDLGNGVSQTTTDTVYAGATAQAGAKAGITSTGASAEAAVKLAADATIRTATTTDYGAVKVTDRAELTAHAEAEAKAGASIGFDGVSLEAKASVEASVKAAKGTDIKIGDTTVSGEIAVIAKAHAEAKANMKANLNPFGKEGVKVGGGYSLEASAGVGLEGDTGFKSDKGNGAQVGGGVYAGKIGVKNNSDVGFKDGKLSLDLDFGFSVGVGAGIKVKATSDVGKIYGDAWKDIKDGDALDKVWGVAQMGMGGVNLIRGMFV